MRMREVLKSSYGDDNPQVPRLLDTVKPSDLYRFLFYFRKIYIVLK